MLIQIFITITGVLGIYFGLFGRFLGKENIPRVVIPTFILLILFLIYLLQDTIKNGSIELILYRWMGCYFNSLNVGFLLDSLSLCMSLIVSIISVCVIIFAYEYMSNDPHINRFIVYLLFFVFFMFFFVTSNNVVQAFIGWEGVGIISYLLINFWFTRMEANRSAFKAIVFNRIGDLGFIIFFVSLLFLVKSSNFNYINSLWLVLNEGIITTSYVDDLECIFYFLLLGAMCKSAQIGLHAWLPDAMEGPTPVSALLHSATMVTAGIYIFLRFAPVLLFFIQINFIMSIIGVITAVVGATVAFFNEDIKKIIAYSTCSQLGLLFSAIGIGNFNGCFFHIVTHAFFKALLFLTAGCIIHAVADEQDIRKMGGLLKYLPYTSICMLVGILGLVGFPFLSGFYSKEFLIFFSFVQANTISNFVTILVFLASIFTMLYGIKLFCFIFLTNYRGFKSNLKFIVEPSFFMSISIGVLSILTIFSGFFLFDLLMSNNTVWLGIFIPVTNYLDIFLQIEMLPFFIKNTLIILFFIFFYFFYFYSNLILEWRILILNKSITTQFIINILNVYLYQTWFWHYIYTSVAKFFINFSFNILILKVNNFIEYSFIIKLKQNIYNFSLIFANSFSTNFFKNFYFFLISVFFIICFSNFLEIFKCIFLNMFIYFFYTFYSKTK
jgi:proton-translocating NADH-quinone oxidoreductase chain L